MSANALAGDPGYCLNADMSDFIAKPLESSQLFAILLRWLNRKAL